MDEFSRYSRTLEEAFGPGTSREIEDDPFIFAQPTFEELAVVEVIIVVIVIGGIGGFVCSLL